MDKKPWGRVRGPLPSGRYQALYTVPGNPERSLGTFADEASAYDALDDEAARVRLGDWASQSGAGRKITVRAWGDKFTSLYALATQKRYDSALRNWVYPDLGPRLLAEVYPIDWEAAILAPAAQGHPAESEMVWKVVNAMLGKAKANGLIASRPALARPTYNAPPVLIPSDAAVHQLYEALPSEIAAALGVQVGTGARISEALAMDYTKIDWDADPHPLWTIDQATAPGPPKGLKAPKEGKTRSVYLGPLTVRIVREHAMVTGRRGLLFLDGNNDVVTSGAFSQVLRRTRVRLGLSRITSHQMRHYFASLANDEGQSPAAIGQQLGHHGRGSYTLVKYIQPLATAGGRLASAVDDRLKSTGWTTG